MTAVATVDSAVAGLVPGTWDIDPSHSDIGFTVRHLMVSKVRGSFSAFTGEIVIDADPLKSSATAEIDLSSIDTRDAGRDTHLKSADFFDVETHPKMTFRATGVQARGSDYVLEGDLTLHDVTRPVVLDVEFLGVQGDPWGGTRAGFSASGEINRRDFGVDFNIPLEGGGVVVGDKVKLSLEIEAVLRQTT